MTVARGGESKGFPMCCSSGIVVLCSSEAISRKSRGREGASKIGASFLLDGTWERVDAALPPSLKTFLALARASAITALCIAGLEIACHLLLVHLQHLLPDAIGRRPLNLIRDIFMEFISRRIASGKVFLLISVSNFQ